MTIVRTRTFRSGDGEALELPREVAFGEGVELVIVRSGDVMTIYPAASSMAAKIEPLRSLPAPPYIERRDDEGLPERPRDDERRRLWDVPSLALLAWRRAALT